MKRLFLSAALLLTVCTLATAQRKVHFGWTVRTGNYLQAQREHQASDELTMTHQLNSGVLVGLGACAEWLLGPHAGLYGALEFSRSTYTDQFSLVYPGEAAKRIGAGRYEQINRFTIHQMSLPIQWQFRTTGRSQLTFSAGVAPSLSTTQVRSRQNHPVFDANVITCGDALYMNGYYADENHSFAKVQVLFTAGLHYRPDAQTGIGLELWLAPKEDAGPLQARGYGYGLPDYSHRMRSLQLVLRHSWQGRK